MAMNPFLREELEELIAEGIKNGEIQECPRWTQAELKTLAIEIAACMPPVSLPAGDGLSQDALNLARVYDRSTVVQRQALDAVAALIRAE